MLNLFLKPINTQTLFLVIAIVAVLAIVFAILIVLVSKLCAVNEDERIGKVNENLAGANCGGCGYAGCADFAKALVEGKATLSNCNATPNENKAEIAKVLGVEFVEGVQLVAVVKCAGGEKAKEKFNYVGNKSCSVQSLLMGGSKVCPTACLAGGECVNVCPDNGVIIKDGVAVVDRSLCEACGACVRKCPRNLIDFVPKDAKVYVACSSKCKGKDVMSACAVGCIGCGLCAKNCPEGAIEMVDNLPVINYEKCSGCLTCVNKCPRKTIKIM